jgi:hypothetical protein
MNNYDHPIILDWMNKGKPLPPPNTYKLAVIKDFAQRFSIPTFVETGTYYGNMVKAVKDVFKRIISVELDNALFINAKRLFSPYPHILILHGDSGKVMPNILSVLHEPALFWLDGHWVGPIGPNNQVKKGKEDLETPIMAELTHILNHPIKNHVILIDDARLFTGLRDYPEVNKLKQYVLARNPNLIFENYEDIIRIYPRS